MLSPLIPDASMARSSISMGLHFVLAKGNSGWAKVEGKIIIGKEVFKSSLPLL